MLGTSHRAYAMDLLGYGYSDKPDPKAGGASPNALYSFETWGAQAVDFLKAVVGGPAFLICNSVGGIVGLQAAATAPSLARGVQLLDVSLRMLHVTKQAAWQRPAVAAVQALLRDTPLGPAFFASLAKPGAVKNVLRQCYGDAGAVTDELVDVILTPGLQPGAAAVFLDFISYSSGPLAEGLLPACEAAGVPVSVLWGAADPWEPVAAARALYAPPAPAVEEFVELPGVGHCPQDEAPGVVNPLIAAFVARHA